FLPPASEDVGGTESRGAERCVYDKLPRSAEVEAPLEDRDRPREISATEVGEAKAEQPEGQRHRMIGCFSDPHGDLSMLDGLVEPAEVGKRKGEIDFRERRVDPGRSKALVPQVAVQRDHVPLKQSYRIGELAPEAVRQAQKGCRDHLGRAIAEGAR